MKPPQFFIEVNYDLEGWDVLSRDAIVVEDFTDHEVMATFYDESYAINYTRMLNDLYENRKR